MPATERQRIDEPVKSLNLNNRLQRLGGLWHHQIHPVIAPDHENRRTLLTKLLNHFEYLSTRRVGRQKCKHGMIGANNGSGC